MYAAINDIYGNSRHGGLGQRVGHLGLVRLHILLHERVEGQNDEFVGRNHARHQVHHKQLDFELVRRLAQLSRVGCYLFFLFFVSWR